MCSFLRNSLIKTSVFHFFSDHHLLTTLIYKMIIKSFPKFFQKVLYKKVVDRCQNRVKFFKAFNQSPKSGASFEFSDGDIAKKIHRRSHSHFSP
jgi:hypothetical protein